jgi:hypothetical protein
MVYERGVSIRFLRLLAVSLQIPPKEPKKGPALAIPISSVRFHVALGFVFLYPVQKPPLNRATCCSLVVSEEQAVPACLPEKIY